MDNPCTYKRFRLSEHRRHLHAWFELHGVSLRNLDELPQHGVIAFWDDEPVAAAFIREVEGGFAMLDGLVSNPKMPGHRRHEAIDGIVERLIEMAKRLNFSRLVAYSVDGSTLTRSKSHGFVPIDHKVIVLDLRG